MVLLTTRNRIHMDQYVDYDIILTPKSSKGERVISQNRQGEVPCVEFYSNTRTRKNSAYNVMGESRKDNKKSYYADKYKKSDQEKRQHTREVKMLRRKDSGCSQAM